MDSVSLSFAFSLRMFPFSFNAIEFSGWSGREFSFRIPSSVADTAFKSNIEKTLMIKINLQLPYLIISPPNL